MGRAVNTHVVPVPADEAQQFGLCVDVPLQVLRPAEIYRRLTGIAPEAADIGSDETFDRHILACITSVAASEAGELTERIGLNAEDLGELLSRSLLLIRSSAKAAASPVKRRMPRKLSSSEIFCSITSSLGTKKGAGWRP